LKQCQKTSSCTPAPKKGTSSSKKQLNFDSNFESLINYNLSTLVSFTLIRAAYDKNLSPGIKCIKLATSNELAKFLQEEEFQRLERENLAKDQKMTKQKELQKAIDNLMQAELKQQKITKKVKKTGDKAEEKESECDEKKKEVLLSPIQKRRIHHLDLTENKFESVAFKKHKIEESSINDDNTQLSLKHYKKSFEAKVYSIGYGKGCGSSLMSLFQTNKLFCQN
jgi:hypothetical protein